MKAGFPAQVRAQALAAEAGMSPSSFRAHFKAATGLTPLQYYKRLRLLETRRLLSSEEGVSAQAVAYRVGYESPSLFSPEYARTFGAPPGRDHARSRAAAG